MIRPSPRRTRGRLRRDRRRIVSPKSLSQIVSPALTDAPLSFRDKRRSKLGYLKRGARKGWAIRGQATRASQALWMPRLFLISKTPSTRDRRQGPLEVGPEVLDVL